MRPVLLIDEAQELLVSVFSELCLLEKLRHPSVQPLASRIRQRLVMPPVKPGDLAGLLDHLIEQPGNPTLITAGLKDTLYAHAGGGNPRTLTVMAAVLLAAASEHDSEVLDEKLFLKTWGEPTQRRRARR